MFLQDLAVVMLVAGLVTIVFHYFKQPVVLGYIVAGVIIGPHTPPASLILDTETVKTLAELGVIMLMFALGLEFNLRKLKQVGIPALIAAFLEILLMVWLGYQIGRMFGWKPMHCIYLGAILSISSTTIIFKALRELGKTREPFAQLIFGILIIEDVLGIAMIALLSGVAMTGTFGWGEVGRTMGKLGVFLVVALVGGLLVVPRLISFVARFKSNEMMLITVLGLCFGFSLLAAKLDYSVALGAFVIGAVIAEAREIHRIEALVEPVRDMFSAVFFVAIGLQIDPKMIAAHWLAILVITVAVVLGKVLTCSFGAFVGGNDTRTSLRVGMGLAQIGEFSFIIASLALTLDETSAFLYPIAVAVSVITTLLTPYLIRSSDGMVNAFDRFAPKALVNYLGLYTRWVGQLSRPQQTNMMTKLVRRWFEQMALNVMLIAAVFIIAVFVAQSPPEWMMNLGLTRGTLKPALWMAAVIVSLPMFIATARKLQALGMLIAETMVTEASAGDRATAVRAFIAKAVPIAGTVVLGVFMLVLSSALLPPFRVLIVLLVLVALIVWLLWRSFIKVYSKAQFALQETLAQQPLPGHDTAHLALPSMLREANLETIALMPDSPAVGKLIRELQLRTQTGASIVGIERAGGNLINPGPDEELQPGDQVLLLGNRAQLQAARAALRKKA
jgi:CPA2 family monovalent cation:H+ antiporter-2